MTWLPRKGREPGAPVPGPFLPFQVVVTSSLTIGAPPTQALVISGPNTGGKTVALKAFGLLAAYGAGGVC